MVADAGEGLALTAHGGRLFWIAGPEGGDVTLRSSTVTGTDLQIVPALFHVGLGHAAEDLFVEPGTAGSQRGIGVYDGKVFFVTGGKLRSYSLADEKASEIGGVETDSSYFRQRAIVADASGKVVEIIVGDCEMVEFGQNLMLLEPLDAE